MAPKEEVGGQIHISAHGFGMGCPRSVQDMTFLALWFRVCESMATVTTIKASLLTLWCRACESMGIVQLLLEVKWYKPE